MIAATGDANLLVSGILGYRRRESTPGELLRRWRTGAYVLSTSEPILRELTRTLATPYFAQRVSSADIAELLPLLTATSVPVAQTVRGVATHPEDDLILATAISANSDYLVTGDRQLQRLSEYAGVRVLSPREFLSLLEAQQRGSNPTRI